MASQSTKLSTTWQDIKTLVTLVNGTVYTLQNSGGGKVVSLIDGDTLPIGDVTAHKINDSEACQFTVSALETIYARSNVMTSVITITEAVA